MCAQRLSIKGHRLHRLQTVANKPSVEMSKKGLQSFVVPPERFISAPTEAILQDLQGLARRRSATLLY